MKRLRVCQVLNAYRVGGAETVALDIACGLDPREFESFAVAVVEPRSDSEPEMRRRFREAGVVNHALNHRSFKDPRTLVDLVLYLRRTRPDIIHAHNRFADYWAWRCGGWAGVRHRIWTRHSLYRDMSSKQLRRYQSAARDVPLVLAVSDAVKENCVAVEGLPEEKVRTVVNGIDTQRFRPLGPEVRVAKRRELGVQEDVAVLLFVGRLISLKGPDLFLSLVETIRRRGVAARGFVCGAGPLAAELAARASAAGVSMLGLRNDIPELLSACDLVVSTSRVEGLPLNLMEAMSAGAAFVAPDLEQVTQLVDRVPELSSGLYPRPPLEGPAPAYLIDLWADVVERRIADIALRDRCGKSGRSVIADRFSMRRMVDEHAQIYREICGRFST